MALAAMARAALAGARVPEVMVLETQKIMVSSTVCASHGPWGQTLRLIHSDCSRPAGVGVVACGVVGCSGRACMVARE
jgi:hypothetical protein